MEKYFYIGCTLLLTMYGQLIVKARSLVHAGPESGKMAYLTAMYTDIGVLSGLAAAVLASVTWTLALEKTGLAFAYPFMALSFVLTPAASFLLFREPVSTMQMAGLALIVIGVTVNAAAH